MCERFDGTESVVHKTLCSIECFLDQMPRGPCETLSGPLNWLNAILSLLQPLDRYKTPFAIGSAIGRPLSRPISHPNTGGSPQPPRSKPLGGLNRAIVVPILNRVLDRD